MQILIVEDELRMAELLRRGLSEEGHRTVVAHNGVEGLALAMSEEFDVIILDLMLPRMSGMEVVRSLRRARRQTPVLILTARDTPVDVIQGLDSGADDYLTKPFAFEILLARIRAVSRRGEIPRSVCLEVADLKLDPGNREVTRAGVRIGVTPREYSLLELLMRNMGRVVPRDTILQSVWGYDSEVNENTLEAYVRLLRQKVDRGEPKLIQTVRGVGYTVRQP